MADAAAKQDPTSGRAWYSLLAIAPDGSTKNVQCDASGNILTTTSSSQVVQNTSTSILASSARTTTQTQADQTNLVSHGLHLIVDVTSAGTGSITPKIQGKDANGIYYDILVGSAITSTGTNVLKIYPGLVPVTNGVANDVLPLTWRSVITANNANSMTYSVAAQILT